MDRSELSNGEKTFCQHSLKRTVWGIKKNQNNQNNKSSDTKFIPAKRHDKNIPTVCGIKKHYDANTMACSYFQQQIKLTAVLPVKVQAGGGQVNPDPNPNPNSDPNPNPNPNPNTGIRHAYTNSQESVTGGGPLDSEPASPGVGAGVCGPNIERCARPAS